MTPEIILEGYKFAASVAEQLIALATGVLSLAVGFATLSKQDPSMKLRRAIGASALVFLLSIVFGLVTLQAIAGHIGQDSRVGIYASNIRLFGALQGVCFLVALGLTIRFGLVALAGPPLRRVPKKRTTEEPKPE